MPTTITFIRHGEVHNPQRILYGRLPRFALSEQGHAEAQAVAATLRDAPVASVYSSPLLRARQTAQAIVDAHPGLTLYITKLLNEVHTSFQGRPLSELAQHSWNLYAVAAPGDEQPQDILDRTLRFIALTRRRHAGQHVVAVTHGDVIAMIICWANGLPALPFRRETLIDVGIPRGYPAHASRSVLTFQTARDDERPQFEYQG